jgi:hypothetical protein
MEGLALGQDGQVQRPEKNRAGGEGVKLTSRPGAYLAGMARQCPRGRPGAAQGGLHEVAPEAPHLGVSTGERS